jgi:hypothetical protein
MAKFMIKCQYLVQMGEQVVVEPGNSARQGLNRSHAPG